MNTPQTLAENRLHKMADDEHQHQQNMTSIRQERAGMKVMKNELAELMGGISCTLKDKIASIQKTVEKIDIKPASLDDKKEKEPDPHRCI